MHFERFINDICDELLIGLPNIIYVDENDSLDIEMSEHILAVYATDSDTIFLRQRDSSYDMYLAIAHELRHKYQYLIDSDYYFKDYKSFNETDSETYNQQIAEIDANAFAKLMMIDVFGIKPLFNGYSQATKKLIDERVEYILNTEYH